MTTDFEYSQPYYGNQNVTDASLSVLWKRFCAQFPTEERCLQELYKRTFVSGVPKCSFCSGRFAKVILAQRVIKCRRCQKGTWLTAGTFFSRIRRARPWLAAIWFIEHGVNISSNKFHKLLNIAYSTAWTILRKITAVVESELLDDVLAVPCSVFSPLISRRSRETPARSHPRTELDETENKSIDPSSTFNSDLAKTISQLSVQEQKVFELMSEQVIHFDQLCARSGLRAGDLSSTLVLLELAGVVQRSAGEWYRRTNLEKSNCSYAIEMQSALHGVEVDQVKIAVGKPIEFVRLRYQGISRKYLQHYLALYWCHIDRSRWQKGALLKACLRFGYLRDREVRDYVSQALVKLAICR